MTDKKPEDSIGGEDKNTLDTVVETAERILPIEEHVEEVAEDGKRVRRKGIYLLPNLVTTGALFAGFYAIVASFSGNFEAAALAIFAAMVMDGLDGRVARMTNTQSAFGEQYDSLSDMVSFGLAPALLAFSWGLQDLGKFGWAAAFIYVASAALRLARFNTQIGIVDKKYFIGLASPSAAAIIASMVWVGHDVEVGLPLAAFSALITAVVGLLMVLNVPYSSFKEVDWHGRVPFVVLLLVVMVFVIVASSPAKVLLLTASLYAMSGPVLFVLQKIRSKSSVDAPPEGD